MPKNFFYFSMSNAYDYMNHYKLITQPLEITMMVTSLTQDNVLLSSPPVVPLVRPGD